MMTNAFIPKKIIAVLGLAVLTAAGAAQAVPLAPGVGAVPTGQSVAGDPTLAGTVVVSKTVPFTCGGGSGTLEQQVVRSTALGTLDFYYKVSNSGTSPSPIVNVRTGDFASSPALDADFRTDILGMRVPTFVERSTGLGWTVDFEFFTNAILPGMNSYTFYARSSRTTFDINGSVMIWYSNIACTIPSIFRPI